MLTMFCLVSRQAMANVLPVLMFKPNNVVLFSTPEEKKSALNLEKLFKRKNIKVVHIGGMNAYNFLSFKDVIKNELTKTNNDTWLNITGGTKLMALAAYEAFAEKNKKIIYCDTEHQHIISLLPEYKIEVLHADLSIEDYLLSYGYYIKEIKELNQVEKYFPLFEFINQNNLMNELIRFFKDLREKLTVNITKTTITSSNKNFVFYKNYDNYSLQFIPQNKKTITIPSSEFKFGDWLEYYIYYILQVNLKLNPITGVKVVSQENVENEIDVLVLKDFVLHNYSCKSGKSDAQYDLFQLEILRTITSGTFGKGYFVTAKKPTPRFMDRAKELRIQVIDITNPNRVFI